MKKVVASLVAVAGFAVAAHAVDNTNVQWQLSLDNSTFANYSAATPLQAAPGATVYARAVVSYITGANGTSVPIGLASFVFQPTVSNVVPGDTLGAFISNGQGGNTSSPIGVIEPTDTTNFGRVSPWGRTALSATSALRGHNNTDSGINYLRIAQTQVTAFFGGTGNTTGGSGVPISQLSNVGRTGADPAFNSQLNGIVVFKFALNLGSSTATRTLTFDSPIAGFGNRNSTTGDREVYWFGDLGESTGQIRGTALVAPSSLVIVPAPASAALLGLGGLAMARRRRQA